MHIWYLSPRHILLAMFSDLVEEDMKLDLARAFLQNLAGALLQNLYSNFDRLPIDFIT